MPRRRVRAGEGGITAEINMTALVDVAFTLLVIFIITAPMLQGGVDIKIPEAKTESIVSPDGVVVSIDREGKIFIGDAPTAWEDFEAAFPEVVRARQARSVYLQADEAVPYGRVVKVLGAMKAADVATVGLVAQPEAETP